MFQLDLWRQSHLFVTVFLSNFCVFVVEPAIRDIIVDAVCTSGDECSLALYLTGFQQAFTGVGSVVMMPVLGNLSDVYGRKKLLLVPLTLAIIPFVMFAILAWQRTTNFFYAYYAFNVLTSMVTSTGVVCLAFAYLADSVAEGQRVSAFGMIYGTLYTGSLSGTLAARFLSPPHIFQLAAAVSFVAVVYTIILLKESSPPDHSNPLEHPILMPAESQIGKTTDCESSKIVPSFMRRIPSLKDIINLLTSSTTFTLLACVSFFESLADTGIRSFLLYFLKARFHFKKNQLADILLITSVGGLTSNMFFVPICGPYIGDKRLLNMALFAAFLNSLLNSIAWSAWVPYVFAPWSFFFSMAIPTISSMVSKQIGPNEQGIAQGCILGIKSLAYIASPLIFTPLSAIFFAKDAPAGFTGLSIFCIALVYVISLILSTFIKIVPRISRARA